MAGGKRGRPKKNIVKVNSPKAPVVTREEEILGTMQDIMKIVKNLEKRVDDVTATVKPSVPIAGSAPASSPSVSGSPSSLFPIPAEFREVVDTVLNKKFDIQIEYLSDSASFLFSILVPKEYSNASPAHWQSMHEDRRTRTILNALGANGVREWATKVYDNFDPETKSRITFDRSQIGIQYQGAVGIPGSSS